MFKQKIDLPALAQRLDDAWEGRFQVAPLSESAGLSTADDAYAVQTYWTQMRLKRGETIIGRKIGLTSLAVQQQLGVNEPDYGSLWASRFFAVHAGAAEAPADLFIQPKVEGELAFLIGKPLREPGVTIEQVLAATEAVAPALEIVDSRIDNWRIKLVDTIADNASYGGFTVGPWSNSLRKADLRTIGMLISHNGQPVVQGIGAAALSHPALAVAWLANKLYTFGITLEPGDIVISGALAATVPARQGDSFVMELHGHPPLTLRFI